MSSISSSPPLTSSRTLVDIHVLRRRRRQRRSSRGSLDFNIDSTHERGGCGHGNGNGNGVFAAAGPASEQPQQQQQQQQQKQLLHQRLTKAEEISLVLSEPYVDLWKLRELALTEGGLVNDTLRKRAWPKLVGLHADADNVDGSDLPANASCDTDDDNDNDDDDDDDNDTEYDDYNDDDDYVGLNDKEEESDWNTDKKVKGVPSVRHGLSNERASPAAADDDNRPPRRRRRRRRRGSSTDDGGGGSKGDGSKRATDERVCNNNYDDDDDVNDDGMGSAAKTTQTMNQVVIDTHDGTSSACLRRRRASAPPSLVDKLRNAAAAAAAAVADNCDERGSKGTHAFEQEDDTPRTEKRVADVDVDIDAVPGFFGDVWDDDDDYDDQLAMAVDTRAPTTTAVVAAETTVAAAYPSHPPSSWPLDSSSPGAAGDCDALDDDDDDDGDDDDVDDISKDDSLLFADDKDYGLGDGLEGLGDGLEGLGNNGYDVDNNNNNNINNDTTTNKNATFGGVGIGEGRADDRDDKRDEKNEIGGVGGRGSGSGQVRGMSRSRSWCGGESGFRVLHVSEVLSTPHKQRKTTVVAQCLDAEQIERDIARCTWHLLTGSQRSRHRQMRFRNKRRMQTLLRRKQRRLGNLINLVLIRSYDGVESDDDKLRYYQGYHDVACVFLHALGGGADALVGSGAATSRRCQTETSKAAARTAGAMGLDLPARVLLQVSRFHLRDAMRSNFHQLTCALRLTILPLIDALDPEVHARLFEVEMEPFFAISWIITWFSHDVRDTALVKRLYDVFLASHPLMPIYMSVAMVLHPVNRLEVLGTEVDFSALHNTLSNLPKNSSSVGWVWTERGYVSGDDDDDDDNATSAADSQSGLDASLVSDEMSMMLGEGSAVRDDDTQSLASTLVLSIPVCNGAKVPFQDIIDMSISFMRRIPPRMLLPLARRYFLDDSARSMLAEASSIALLQPPPDWGLAPRAPSDWVLKQRARQNNPPPSSRRRRRSGSRSRSPNSRKRRGGSDAAGSGDDKEESDPGGVCGARSSDAGLADAGSPGLDLACDNKSFIALVASGMGPAGEYEERAKRRRRKRIIVGSIAIAVVSIAIGLVRAGALDYLLGKAKDGHAESSSSSSSSSSSPEQSSAPPADANQCKYDSFQSDVVDNPCIGSPPTKGFGPPVWGKLMKSSVGFIRKIQRVGQHLDSIGEKQVRTGEQMLYITQEQLLMAVQL